MKISVSAIEHKPHGYEFYDLSVDKVLDDVAFYILNFRLSGIASIEPVDEEVDIWVYREPTGEIKWAFKGTPSDEARNAVRVKMNPSQS
jgi:hypothetical protein